MFINQSSPSVLGCSVLLINNNITYYMLLLTTSVVITLREICGMWIRYKIAAFAYKHCSQHFVSCLPTKSLPLALIEFKRPLWVDNVTGNRVLQIQRLSYLWKWILKWVFLGKGIWTQSLFVNLQPAREILYVVVKEFTYLVNL